MRAPPSETSEEFGLLGGVFLVREDVLPAQFGEPLDLREDVVVGAAGRCRATLGKAGASGRGVCGGAIGTGEGSGGAGSGTGGAASAGGGLAGAPASGTTGRSATRTSPSWLVKVRDWSPLCCCEKPEIRCSPVSWTLTRPPSTMASRRAPGK